MRAEFSWEMGQVSGLAYEIARSQGRRWIDPNHLVRALTAFEAGRRPDFGRDLPNEPAPTFTRDVTDLLDSAIDRAHREGAAIVCRRHLLHALKTATGDPSLEALTGSEWVDYPVPADATRTVVTWTETSETGLEAEEQ